MNDDLKPIQDWWKSGNEDYAEFMSLIEAFYRAAFNAGLEAAKECYSPDDLAHDWMDKIRELEKR